MPNGMYAAVNQKYASLDAAVKFDVGTSHDTNADTVALYNFDNAQMDAQSIPNVFLRSSTSTDVSVSDSFSAIHIASLQQSMSDVKNILFYFTAVTDTNSVFDPSAVQQVYVPEVSHDMSMVETKHFQVYYEPPFANAVPGAVEKLDTVFNEDQWWNYNPTITRKIRIYLVTSSDEGWATAHRTPESTNKDSGGIQSPSNYSVSVVRPTGTNDPNEILGTVAHEFNHDSATYELSALNENTRPDLDNQEVSGHVTPMMFVMGQAWALQYYQNQLSALLAPPVDPITIDWSEYTGNNFLNLTPQQWSFHYDKLGSLEYYIWLHYGADKAREIDYAMYSNNRVLAPVVQSELGYPFEQVVQGWYKWLSSNSSTQPGSQSGAFSLMFPTSDGQVFQFSGVQLDFSRNIQLPSDYSGIMLLDSQGNSVPISYLEVANKGTGLNVVSHSLQSGSTYTVIVAPNRIRDLNGNTYPQQIKVSFTVKLS